MTSLIMDYLLKAPLDSDKECMKTYSTQSLSIVHALSFCVDLLLALCEETLVTFLAPSQAIIDTVITQYKERINNMARRFFHLLLRQACPTASYRRLVIVIVIVIHFLRTLTLLGTM